MRGITIVRSMSAAIAALSIAACTNTGSTAEKQNELIAREVMAVWQSGDTSSVVNLFRPDAVYDDFPQQLQYDGIEDIVGHLLSFQSWATNISMDVANVYTGPTSATAEWTLSLVQNRPLGSLVPEATNRNVVINGVTIFQIQGGRITHAADYWDASQLAIQLGGKVVFPGGTTWQENGDTTSGGGGGGGR